MSIESDFHHCFGFALLYTLCLAKKICTTFQLKSDTKPKTTVTCSNMFLTLGPDYIYLLRVLIGSLDFLHFL